MDGTATSRIQSEAISGSERDGYCRDVTVTIRN
jgi:hypothetical protein